MNYLILGAGKSAIECLKTLIKRNKKVSICLNEDEEIKIKEYKDNIENIYYFTNFYKIEFNNFNYIIRSPGISALNPYIKYLKDHNINMINEVELTYLLSNKKGYYIGITGSNGKSTTVTMLYECLKKQTNNVLLAGNIGIPLISLIDKINNYTIIILEMSSFALEDMRELKFDIGVILNLSINHLDSVPSLDYYYLSKFNILNLQTSNDYFIINNEDNNIKEYLNKVKIKAKVIDYSKEIIDSRNIKLKGVHNISNIKVVKSILDILGFKIDYSVIRDFEALEYHMQEIKTNKNYIVVNDSKSTTVESLKMAINTYLKHKIILIFGGKNKGGDFSFLNNYDLKRKICFGKLSEELSDVFVDYKSYYLDQAIEDALSNVKENDVILFSCGCSSFDLFNNYLERGEYFNKLINN